MLCNKPPQTPNTTFTNNCSYVLCLHSYDTKWTKLSSFALDLIISPSLKNVALEISPFFSYIINFSLFTGLVCPTSSFMLLFFPLSLQKKKTQYNCSDLMPWFSSHSPFNLLQESFHLYYFMKSTFSRSLLIFMLLILSSHFSWTLSSIWKVIFTLSLIYVLIWLL